LLRNPFPLSSTYKQIEYLNIRELSMHKSEYPPNDSGAEFVQIRLSTSVVFFRR
jgi:hypothetical protein